MKILFWAELLARVLWTGSAVPRPLWQILIQNHPEKQRLPSELSGSHAGACIRHFGKTFPHRSFYIVVMVLLGAAIYLVHRRVSLSPGVLWCLSIWGLLHMAGGLVPVPESAPIGGPVRVLYSLWLIPGALKYDQMVHAYGFGVATWMCWQALSFGFRKTHGFTPDPTFGLLTLCAAAGMGLGAFT